MKILSAAVILLFAVAVAARDNMPSNEEEGLAPGMMDDGKFEAPASVTQKLSAQ